MKKLFIQFVLCSCLACQAGEEVDALKLRETLRETSAVYESTAKMNADFDSLESDLEGRIKLLNALNAKLQYDVNETKALIEKKKSRNAEAVRELEQISKFESNLAALVDFSNEGDVYAKARDGFDALKKSVLDSETLAVVKGANGKRVLRIGIADSISEDSSPEAAKVCDMIEGKISFDFVRLQISAKDSK